MTKILTKEEIEAIRQRCDAASPGPYHSGGIFDPMGERPTSNIWGPTPRDAQSGELLAQKVKVKDADFFVCARIDIPALIESHEGLRKSRHDLQDAFGKCHKELSEARSEIESLKEDLNPSPWPDSDPKGY